MRFLIIAFMVLVFLAISREFNLDSEVRLTKATFSELKASLNLAKFYMSNKNFPKANDIYQNVIRNKPISYIMEEAIFMLAEISFFQMNKKEAKKRYKRYIRDYPFGGFNYNAFERLKQLDQDK